MKLYTFTTPEISKHSGYLKIGETNGDVEKHYCCARNDVGASIRCNLCDNEQCYGGSGDVCSPAIWKTTGRLEKYRSKNCVSLKCGNKRKSPNRIYRLHPGRRNLNTLLYKFMK